MLIRELSYKTGASVRSIRYYETKKLLVSKRLENGYRDYDDKAIERVKTIQLYLGLGISTDDMAQIIECPATQNERPLCKAAYELYKSKLKEVDKQLDILHTIQIRLQQRISELDKISNNGVEKSNEGGFRNGY